jgi:hypothetical protein
MNERWVVELNTFSSLVAGLAAAGLARIWRGRKSGAGAGTDDQVGLALLATSAVISVSIHVLLVVPWIALWLCILMKGGGAHSGRDRRIAAGISVALVAVMAVMLLKGERARELGALMAFVAALGFLPAVLPEGGLFRMLGALLRQVRWAGLLLVPHFLIFAEGNWQAKQYIGFLAQPFWVGSIALPLGVAVYLLRRSGGRLSQIPLAWQGFLAFSLLLTYALVPKVGARYFEIPFLALAAAFAWALARLPSRHAAVVLGLALIFSVLELEGNYFAPARAESQVAVTWRIPHLLKESSEDFLPKTRLLRFLASHGCGTENIADGAKSLELRFMALGDWPAIRAGGCELGRITEINALRSDEPNSAPVREDPGAGVWLEFPFEIRGAVKSRDGVP